MSRGITVLSALSMSLLLLAGCSAAGNGPQEVKIVTTEMHFSPDVVQAKAGQKIKFVIDNKGKVEHEFVSDDIAFHEVEVEPGESKFVEVTMPAEPGEYKFYCEAKGHKEAGMVGKIVVSK